MNENPDLFLYPRILLWRALLELVKQFQGKGKKETFINGENIMYIINLRKNISKLRAK